MKRNLTSVVFGMVLEDVMKVQAVVTMVLGLSMSLLGQERKSVDIPDLVEPAGGGPFVTLTDGDVTVSVNSYGVAGNTQFCNGPPFPAFGMGFRSGTESVLCQHLDFYSDGGPVKAITSAGSNCTTVNAISSDAPNHATSTVKCGACTIDFDQSVDATTGWTTGVTISACDAACYYSYTDYDVFHFQNNGGAWHDGEGGFLGQFVVRHNTMQPDVHYLFSDQSGASSWQQTEFMGKALIDRIRAFQQCTVLSNSPLTFSNGDWTAAFAWTLSGDGSTLSYSHFRDDSVPFP